MAWTSLPLDIDTLIKVAQLLGVIGSTVGLSHIFTFFLERNRNRALNNSDIRNHLLEAQSRAQSYNSDLMAQVRQLQEEVSDLHKQLLQSEKQINNLEIRMQTTPPEIEERLRSIERILEQLRHSIINGTLWMHDISESLDTPAADPLPDFSFEGERDD